MVIKHPKSLVVGNNYSITEPDYENIGEQPVVIEVIGKYNGGVILKIITDGSTYKRSYGHLLNCKIEQIYSPQKNFN